MKDSSLSNSIKDRNCLNSSQIMRLREMGLEPERQEDRSWILREKQPPEEEPS